MVGGGETVTRKDEQRCSCLPCRVRMDFSIEPECSRGTLGIPLIETATGQSWNVFLKLLLSHTPQSPFPQPPINGEGLGHNVYKKRTRKQVLFPNQGNSGRCKNKTDTLP